MKVRRDAHIAFATDRGVHRVENQDDLLVYEPADDESYRSRGRLIALADGMGGATAGGEASRIALRAFLASWLDATLDPDDDESWRAALLSAYGGAQAALDAAVSRNRRLEGMGTTLTAFVQRGSRVRGVHVGDSRCLILQDGDSRWLTSLHTSPLADSRLTRALVAGQPGDLEPEYFEHDLRAGDRLLLMSDGLWRAIPEAEGLATIESCSAEEAVVALLLRARSVDGTDNASFLVLEYSGEGDVDAEPAYDGRVTGPATGRSPEYVEVHETEVQAAGPSLEAMRGPGRLARTWPWVLLVLGAILGGIALWLRR